MALEDIKRDVGYTVKFWYPITATYEEADYSIIIKAPNEDNNEKRARNQTTVRTRAGRTIVYDRGNNLNTMMKLEFENIRDVERSSLVVFLEAVQWASSKIAYQDMYGDIYYVRILEESGNGITYVDKGVQLRNQTKKQSTILWNFNLDLLNLTDNIAELDEEDPPVSGALALHLADFDEPHNPEVCTSLDIADSAKVIEAFKTTDWKSITWMIIVSKGARKCVFLATITHNRDGVTDATVVTDPYLTFLNEVGTSIYSVLTVSSAISGVGGDQVMQLKIATSEDGLTVCIRRTKM